MKLASLILAFVLAGCASAPIAPPLSDLFSKAESAPHVIVQPDPLPPRPKATICRDADGQEALCFQTPEAVTLLRRTEVAEINTEIARECGAAFNELAAADRLLLEQARTLERQYNLTGQDWADAEAALNSEQRSNQLEVWFYRALLLIFAGVAL